MRYVESSEQIGGAIQILQLRIVRRIEGSEVCSVVAAIEARQVAVDGHSGSSGSNCKGTWITAVVPIGGANSNILRIAAAYDTYWSTLGGRQEVELYSRPVGNGKGEI